MELGGDKMPGLKGIENIKRSMGQRVEEREGNPKTSTAESTPMETAAPPSTPGRYSKHSTIRKSYEEKGIPPRRHLELYKAIKTALNGEWEGEIDFGSVLDTISMARGSANSILKHLEHFGYVQHEGRFRCTWFKILK